MMDGRFKVKDPQLGTGKQDLFNSFRNQILNAEAENGIESSLLRKDKNKREGKKSLVDDEVLRSYD